MIEILTLFNEFEHFRSIELYTQNIHQSIIKIWKNREFKYYFLKLKNYQSISSGLVCLLDRICKVPQLSSFKIDIETLICVKEQNNGTQELNNQFERVDLKLIDVKVSYNANIYPSDLTNIIFICPIYNEFCSNSLEKSLVLFEEIINQNEEMKIEIIFSKIDILFEMIRDGHEFKNIKKLGYGKEIT
jgi:hypothetical protein